MVWAATCGRALSWRNDTDVCALFLLFRAFEKCRVIFSVYCATLCEEIHVQYTFRVPEDGGQNLPSKERGFRFFGFRGPWMTPLHWRTFALGREVKHPRLIRCHNRIKKKKSPSCSYRDNNDCRHLQPCTRVSLSIHAGSIGCTLSSTEGVILWLFSHYHHWYSVFQATRGQLFAFFPPNDCIDAVTVLACYGSPRPALMRFILHRFTSFFKRIAALIGTNIWQCLLTILPLQSWTDFRWFTNFFRQEFDYDALFHANAYLLLAHLPQNWQNWAVANTRSVTGQ